VATLEVGRVCVKTAGREAGKYCVVLKKLDDSFVLITGPKTLTGVKRRRCNIEHLEPTPHSVKIAAEATDAAVIKAYDAIGLTKKFGLKLPSPEVVKEAEKKVPKVKVEKPKKVEKPPEKPKVEKPKEEKKPEKPKEEPKKKKGITIKFKVPSLRRKKKPEVKKVKPKPKKKVEKKPKKKKPEKKKPKKVKKKPAKKKKKK